jgi:hypothetical protein
MMGGQNRDVAATVTENAMEFKILDFSATNRTKT